MGDHITYTGRPAERVASSLIVKKSAFLEDVERYVLFEMSAWITSQQIAEDDIDASR